MGLLTAGQPRREDSAVVEQPKKSVFTVTTKARDYFGTLMASLEQAQKAVDALRKKKVAFTPGFCKTMDFK